VVVVVVPVSGGTVSTDVGSGSTIVVLVEVVVGAVVVVVVVPLGGATVVVVVVVDSSVLVGGVSASGAVVVGAESSGLASAIEPGRTISAATARAAARGIFERDTMHTTSRRPARYQAIRRVFIGKLGLNLERLGDIVRAPWTHPVT
jgi:hypothetical protein